jgi:ABC-type dipeptide/oligopeptide/nickel transport system ATPase component
MSDLHVKPLYTAKASLPQSPYMVKKIINEFPSLLLIVGRSGSGKSAVVNWMMTNSNYLKDFYDKVYLFSPTAEIDDLTQHLKLKKESMITKPTAEALDKIIDSQERLVKSMGLEEAGKKHKTLIIFDDIISSPKFLKSDAMTKLATMGRHFLISSIVNTQSYTKVPRPIRLQAQGLILFPSSNNEVKLLVEDVAPPNCTKKNFLKVVQYATSGKHDFLFVHTKSPVETRFRKGFKEYLNPCPS